ncbi:MAG: HAMP domain-containing histidine kinase [Clostridia bacterium]|nr:HAMP domain-containing histidine kinase [Clostridia bacterium]
MKNKKRTTHLWRYFVLIIAVGFLVAIIFQSSLIVIVDEIFKVKEILNVSQNRWIVLGIIFTGVLLGGTTTVLVSRKYFAPITKLSAEMKKVAQGNFDIQLETKSKIKAIKEIYSDFNLMVRELNATETLQTDFVSNVSHEIKTPITAIEGYATLLQNGNASNEEQQEYIDKILFNTKKLSELVGNVLLLSKVDNKAIQAKKEQFRLDEQIRQSLVLLEPKWNQKELEFSIDMDEIDYVGDKGLMIHIWNNLIDNAIKFSPPKDLIEISLKKDGEKVIFVIKDNGPGIEESEATHIFNKFYQCDSSHKIEGNGLGLSLVKNILSLMNGEVKVENAQSGGARFTVTL